MVLFHQAPSEIERRIEVCAPVWTYKCRDDILRSDLGLYLNLRARVVSDDRDLGVIL
jgi:hypothetical protein